MTLLSSHSTDLYLSFQSKQKPGSNHLKTYTAKIILLDQTKFIPSGHIHFNMQRLFGIIHIPAHSREDSVVSLFVPRRLLLKLNGLLVDDFSPLPVSFGVVGTSGVKDHYDARAISLSRLSGTESTPSLWLKSCISEPQL